MKKFEIIDHTADVGITAYGRDLKELFANAAEGMFSIMTDLPKIRNPKSEIRNVRVEARDREELLIRWLNELLFQSVTQQLLFSRFEIKSITDNQLVADVYGQAIDSPKNITTEIKAATYHQLEIMPPGRPPSASPRRGRGGNAQSRPMAGWRARIIFDI